MNRRFTVAIATTAALGLAGAGLAATANAAIPKNQIRIVGGVVVKPGQYVKDNQRFKAANTTAKSGAVVTLVNRSKTEDPHTITFIEKKFLPEQFESGLEEQILTAHGADPESEGPPANLVVDNGLPLAAGAMLEVDTMFNETVAGDSAFIAPGQKEFKFKVTADKGSRLFFYCAIHPWMQGKLTVN